MPLDQRTSDREAGERAEPDGRAPQTYEREQGRDRRRTMHVVGRSAQSALKFLDDSSCVFLAFWKR
jgi:hypothetical protein